MGFILVLQTQVNNEVIDLHRLSAFDRYGFVIDTLDDAASLIQNFLK